MISAVGGQRTTRKQKYRSTEYVALVWLSITREWEFIWFTNEKYSLTRLIPANECYLLKRQHVILTDHVFSSLGSSPEVRMKPNSKARVTMFWTQNHIIHCCCLKNVSAHSVYLVFPSVDRVFEWILIVATKRFSNMPEYVRQCV